MHLRRICFGRSKFEEVPKSTRMLQHVMRGLFKDMPESDFG